MRHKFCNPAPDGTVAEQVTVGKELQVQPAEGFADSGIFWWECCTGGEVRWQRAHLKCGEKKLLIG